MTPNWPSQKRIKRRLACSAHWLQAQTEGYNAQIENVTDSWAPVLLTELKSREVLQRFSPKDLTHSVFPWLTTHIIAMGSAQVRAIRVSYAGKLGYELCRDGDFTKKCSALETGVDRFLDTSQDFIDADTVCKIKAKRCALAYFSVCACDAKTA